MTTALQAPPPDRRAPSPQPLRILHLEDNHADSAVVRRYLDRHGFGGHIVHVDCRASFLDQLACDVDLVLADHSMPGFDSCEALRLVQDRCPGVPFIIVSGTITEAAAVKSIKSGASDYVWKDRMQRLGPAIENALRERQHRTEHDAARQAHRANEERYRTLFDSIDEGFCIMEVLVSDEGEPVDWRFLEANPAFEKITGLADAVGRRMREIEPQHEAYWFETYGRVARTGEPERFTAEAAQLNGRTYDHYAFRVGASEERKVAVLFSDVTDKKRAEAALRESESQYAQIADAMPQIMWTTDPTGYHDYFNERWYVYTGMARPAEQGGPVREFDWNDYLHPDDAEPTFERWSHSLATGEPYEVEYRFRRAADGAYRWFIGRAMPVLDAAGAVVRWFGTCTDVHDLRDARDDVRKSDERLRLVGQATNDTVWDWDTMAEGVAMNAAFTNVFGWAEPEDGGFTIGWMLSHIHPDDLKRVAESLHGVAWGDERTWEAEYRFERTDGTWADVLNRCSIVRSDDGKALRVVGAVIDLSARRATELALIEAKEAAEEVARAKSSLLMNMSHEIRTPLTAVIGYAEMLAQEAPPDLMDLVEPIERGGKRLLDTLNSVLDLAQIEADALPLASVAVDLWAEAEAAIAALLPLAQAKGIALGLSGPPAVVRADRAALGRVLTNLVGNAVKFTERGTVGVEVGAEGERAWVRVSDTGVGIDAAFLPHVFDDFKQESSGANRTHEGSGLGLAITRGLVGKMGGEISVVSEKGVGSTFTVWLPAG